MVDMLQTIRNVFCAIRIPFSLTLFGRSLLLISLEVVANAIFWAFAARSHAILALAMLSWTIGLRHEYRSNAHSPRRRSHKVTQPTVWYFQLILDLSAIDNATRTLIGRGQLAITCGLFFSLGHSTIVIVVNVAIIISTSVYNKLGGVSSVGSIVGTAISGSFLFIIGLVNSIILCKILRQRRRARRKQGSERGETDPELDQNQNMLMMRLLGPLVNFVNRPWKMYPVGVLFGLGFDTASSIALLTISALAENGKNDTRIAPSDTVILPLLFTAGMTLVDSLDSILMLYSYTGFVDRSWRIFEPSPPPKTSDARSVGVSLTQPESANKVDVVPHTDQSHDAIEEESRTTDKAVHGGSNDVIERKNEDHVVLVKRSTMSQLSIILTTMSILLAFGVSLIEIMGQIGANCKRCEAAASAQGGGGLAGAWWRAWAVANENYGYIGAGIVGVFVVLVGGWYTCQRLKIYFS